MAWSYGSILHNFLESLGRRNFYTGLGRARNSDDIVLLVQEALLSPKTPAAQVLDGEEFLHFPGYSSHWGWPRLEAGPQRHSRPPPTSTQGRFIRLTPNSRLDPENDSSVRQKLSTWRFASFLARPDFCFTVSYKSDLVALQYILVPASDHYSWSNTL